MPEVDAKIADHYTTGALTDRIKSALQALGVDPAAAQPEDLKPVDEFHTGGVEATDHLFAQLDIDAATRVLDIGSGLGGTARYVAHRFGADVTGVDLTPEFVECARDLSAMVGLSDKTTFSVGSGLALPAPDASADLALLLHVGMNIEDKTALFAEAARVLDAGGAFAIFDVMRADDAKTPLLFPLPWSTAPETSFVAPPTAYLAAAETAGFKLVAQNDRAEFAADFFDRAFAAMAANGPAPLGIHLMMGETAGQKIQNYVANLKSGRIAPTEMIFRKP